MIVSNINSFSEIISSKEIEKYIELYNLSTLRKTLANSSEIIAVHQMAKVGSTSVCESLKKKMPETPIFHTHFLNYSDLKARIIKARKQGINIQDHLIESLILLEALQDTNKEVKIITLIRDPIARNVSGFFQSINVHFYDFYRRYSQNQIKTDELVKTFMEKFPHKIPLNWLDREINNVFDIDVYQTSFDHHKSYSIYEKKNRTILLLIKLEYLNKSYQSAFEDFLGLNVFNLENKNIGSSKKYFQIYEEFKERICFSNDYIEMMYNSKFVTHFYTKEEINKYKAKWSQ